MQLFIVIKNKKLLRTNCNLIFLPAYSPDLNPIETLWANFKANVKNYINKFSSLAETIDYVFREDHLKFDYLYQQERSKLFHFMAISLIDVAPYCPSSLPARPSMI